VTFPYFIASSPDRFCVPRSFLSSEYLGLFSMGVKRPVRKADHSLPSSAEVNNGRAIPQTSRLFVFIKYNAKTCLSNLRRALNIPATCHARFDIAQGLLSLITGNKFLISQTYFRNLMHVPHTSSEEYCNRIISRKDSSSILTAEFFSYRILISEMLRSKFLRKHFHCFCICMITQFLVSSSTVPAQNVSLMNYYCFCVGGESL
jgi:hypothetical protein